jgi:hypothetical protein
MRYRRLVFRNRTDKTYFRGILHAEDDHLFLSPDEWDGIAAQTARANPGDDVWWEEVEYGRPLSRGEILSAAPAWASAG